MDTFAELYGMFGEERRETDRKMFEKGLLDINEKLDSCTSSDRQSLLEKRNKVEYFLSKVLGNPQMRLGMVLRQKLPNVRFEWRTPSTVDKYGDVVPKSVRQWPNFLAEVREYNAESFVSPAHPISMGVSSMLTMTEVCNHDSAQLALNVVLDYLLLNVFPGFTVRLQQRSSTTSNEVGRSSPLGSASEINSAETIAKSLSRLKTIEPDMVVVGKENEAVLAIEMKPPGTFGKNDGEALDLVNSYNSNERLHFVCVRQLLTCMVQLKLGYGILSAADATYFVRRVKENGLGSDYSSLEISKGIIWRSEDPTLLEALHFIICAAIPEMENFKMYKFESKGERSGKYKEDGKDDSLEKKAKKGRKNETLATGTGISHLIGQITVADLPDTPAEDLHLEQTAYSSGGWSGGIGRGLVNGEKVAVKIAPRYSDRAEALLKEITAYKRLERYWGIYVPELVKYGTTVNGTLVFIATKLIEGLSWRDAPTQAKSTAAEEALHAIHSCGLLHGDIHGGNLIVVEGGVRFIDFGFSKFITSEADCKKELNQLKTMSQTNCISTVTQ